MKKEQKGIFRGTLGRKLVEMDGVSPSVSYLGPEEEHQNVLTVIKDHWPDRGQVLYYPSTENWPVGDPIEASCRRVWNPKSTLYQSASIKGNKLKAL